MGDLVPPNATNAPGNNDKKENKDTLFGPNIGVVGGGPEWCEKDRKDSKSVEDEDELTPHVVREWVRKSKDVGIRFSIQFSRDRCCVPTPSSFYDLAFRVVFLLTQ